MSLDPTVYEFCALTASEAQATEFARQHIKTKFVRTMRGTSQHLLPGHLTEYWFKKLHCQSLTS